MYVLQSTLQTIAELRARSVDELDAWLYTREDDEVLIESRQSYSRVILSLALMTFWFRILHIFSVIRILGPKLVMIGRMVSIIIILYQNFSLYTLNFYHPDFYLLSSITLLLLVIIKDIISFKTGFQSRICVIASKLILGLENCEM